jgi:hypothetical protein
MNLNRKAHRVWPSLISSQAVDGYTQPRRTDSYPLATGYWSLETFHHKADFAPSPPLATSAEDTKNNKLRGHIV